MLGKCIKTFLETFKVKTSSKTQQQPYKIVTTTRHSLTSKIFKLFFQIVLKNFHGSDGGIVGIQNIRSYFLFRMITKILGSDVFIKIFSRKSTPPPAGGGVNIFDVTLIASDAICSGKIVENDFLNNLLVVLIFLNLKYSFFWPLILL